MLTFWSTHGMRGIPKMKSARWPQIIPYWLRNLKLLDLHNTPDPPVQEHVLHKGAETRSITVKGRWQCCGLWVQLPPIMAASIMGDDSHLHAPFPIQFQLSLHANGLGKISGIWSKCLDPCYPIKDLEVVPGSAATIVALWGVTHWMKATHLENQDGRLK